MFKKGANVGAWHRFSLPLKNVPGTDFLHPRENVPGTNFWHQFLAPISILSQ
jgi:hypothetical protein